MLFIIIIFFYGADMARVFEGRTCIGVARKWKAGSVRLVTNAFDGFYTRFVLSGVNNMSSPVLSVQLFFYACYYGKLVC